MDRMRKQSSAESIQEFAHHGFHYMLAIAATGNKIKDLILMIVFWGQGDVVWTSFYLTFISLSTFLDAILSIMFPSPQLDKVSGVILSILQLKTLADSLVDHPEPHTYRIIKFTSAVFQSLPISFLLTYVIMLELHQRVSENSLEIGLFMSFVSFALGITDRATSKNSYFMSFIVFIQALSQFVFRMMAVSIICVRYEVLGALFCAASLVITYIFGPAGIFTNCLSVFNSKGFNKHNDEDEPNGRDVCYKAVVVPVTFFIVFDPLIGDEYVVTSKCFSDTYFLFWRLIENFVFIALFYSLPSSLARRTENQYDSWLSNPIQVLTIAVLSTIVILGSWVIIHRHH